MGIRIHKDIGYYLAKKHISLILVNNYDDILDDLDVLNKDFFANMELELLALHQSDMIAFNYAKIQLKQLINNQDNSKFSIYRFIKSIYNYDTFKGMLFQTPELSKSSHFDDLIDYYEHVNKPVFKLNLLKQSLYPDNYYLCVKVPDLNQNSLEIYAIENTKKPVLEVGDLVSSDKLHLLMFYQNIEHTNQKVNTWAYPQQDNEKYFHPYINVLTFLAGKVSGIIKPEISYLQFSQYLEPAIVTHWN